MDGKRNNNSKYPAFKNNNWKLNSVSDSQDSNRNQNIPPSSTNKTAPLSNNPIPQKMSGPVAPIQNNEPQYQSQYLKQGVSSQKQPQPQPTQPSLNQTPEIVKDQSEPPIQVSTTQEHIIQSSEPVQGEGSRKSGSKSKGKIILFFVFLLLMIFIASSSALIYAIAYEKIDIPNKPLQRKVAHFVMTYIPFAPATPEYIIEKAALTHKTITKTSYNLSLAVNTDQGSITDFGLDNFDMKIDGAIDFSNPNNILATADISVSNAFGMQIMTKDDILYFKVSQFPTEIFTLLNVDPSGFDPLINHWITYDTSTLDSEARTFLDEEIISKQQELLEEQTNSTEEIIDEKILEKITVSDDVYNGFDSYKLEFIADGDLIDYIVEKVAESQSQDDLLYTYSENESFGKPSDYIQEFKVLAWIEKKTFYTRKVLFSTTVVSSENSFDLSTPFGFLPSGESGKTEITITGAILLDNFGKNVVINIPNDPMSTDEVFEIFNKAVYSESYMDTYNLPQKYYNETIPEEEISLEELYPEYYYELESVNDVLGWFDQRLGEVKK